MFNPISSTIVKWLRFKVVSWGYDLQPCTANDLELFDWWVIIIEIV
jgi:hypothetical protein